ncbi:MAG: flagellar M-ring protein FliF C-terminal domain-containing protein [Planctomycetota bacterium]
MGSLQNILVQIRAQLGKMTASQQLLLGSLAVIMLMALFLLSQYAGQPQKVELMPADEGAASLVALQQAGIEAENRGGTIFVSASDRRAALAQLGQQGMLPNDTTILFGNLLEKQSWRHSHKQNEQLFLIALQNELGRTMSLWDGIRSATVLIDMPDPNGVGKIVRTPTASATVFSSDGGPLNQKEVDAIAGFIAGARAGLTPASVRVIDGSTGQQRRPTEEGSAIATTYLEHTATVERELQRKLSDLLAYIPGVIVAVTAQVDVTHVNEQRKEHLALNEGTVSLPGEERRTEETMSEQSRGAEPGVRSNAAADINRGSGGTGTQTSRTDEEISFQNAVGTSVRQIVDPRGHPTRLAASINIPMGYVRSLVDRTLAPAAEGEEPPVATDEQVEARFAAERARIVEAIRPHLNARDALGAQTEGEVVVSMIPIDVPALGSPQRAGVLGGFGDALGGGNLMASGGLIDKAVLGVLSVAALGMMALMVRKAGKRVELPSASELVGLPPTLEGDGDLVGEADETEAAMQGIEVGDDAVRTNKIREEVETLVQQDAQQAAKLLTRWMAEDG